MRRVHISAFGSGLGHATRMLSVARSLAARGDAVRFSSSGDAVLLIRNAGYECSDLPLVDVSWTKDGRFSALDTARSFPFLVGRFARQVREEARNIASFGADAVLSDSMLSTVVASRLTGTRVVTVLNQLRLETSARASHLVSSLVSAGTVSIGATVWNLSNTIVLPDLPAPYTISERNLWSSGRAKSRYIGFLTPPRDGSTDRLVQSLRTEKKMKVYWQVSGPARTRLPLLSAAFRVARAVMDSAVSIVSGGDPTGSVEPSRTPFGWVYEWCPVKDSLLETADFVVSRAGHTSIAQFILNEKPSVLVPIPEQTEQEGNAAKAEKLGIAIRIKQDELGPETFTQAIEKLKDRGVGKRLHELSLLARRHDALSEILGALS